MAKIICIFVILTGLMWIYNPQTAVSSEPLPHYFHSEHHKNLNKMQTKKCTVCGKVKSFNEFGKDSKAKYELNYACKICNCLRAKEYHRTKQGLINLIYSNQKKTSIRRGHNPPSYTNLELKEWCLKQDLFHKLYYQWVLSGFYKMLTPSCDRKKDHKPYTLDNLQLTTWKRNKQKGLDDMRNGKLTHGVNPQKAVIGTHKINGNIIEFHSMSEAQRRTGIRQGNISSCCHGKKGYSHAGGYVWEIKI